MKIVFAKSRARASGAAVVFVAEGRKLSPAALALDKASQGAIRRALAASRFKGEAGECLSILAPKGLRVRRVVLLGNGSPEKLDHATAERIGGRLVAHLNGDGESEATLAVATGRREPIDEAALAAAIAEGATLRAYRFDKYKTKQKPEQRLSLKTLTLALEDPDSGKRLFQPREKVAAAIAFTRDLVSEPANVIYPKSLAEAASRLESLGVKVTILGEAEMKELGMGALLGVGQGSAQESQLVSLEWQGAADSDRRPIAFVGKGVTFDTGGISLKPAAGMEDMKWDMAGAGAVIGTMRALAARKAKVNAVGIVGLVENMPSGTAQRPGDIVTTMSGQTVEVLNTDAEGRLVLADALWYAQQNFKPSAVIDLATLTGAIMVALGEEYAGLFSNNDELANHLIAAGSAVDEKLWRMPLARAYDKLLDSPAADIKNISNGRYAGAITAAQFLQRFIRKGTAWAHLDIAGMAWNSRERALTPKGASGFGVRLLDRLVADRFEEK